MRRARGGVILWLVGAVLALMPLVSPLEPARAERTLALVTVSVAEFDEERDSLVPVRKSCVLVSIWLGQVGRYCDGSGEDTDEREGFIGFKLPAGMVYTYQLDMEANLPEYGYSESMPSGPLPESGAEVFFEGMSCKPHCPPYLSYFIALPTDHESTEGQPDGVPVIGACFVLRLADGSTLPEQCSTSEGYVDFTEVVPASYQIEPTSLPNGCVVGEMMIPQPLQLTEEMIDESLNYGPHGTYAGDIYLDCDSVNLASLTVTVVQCPTSAAEGIVPCDGDPLEGVGFTFSEALWLPPVLTGADGTDTVPVAPGTVSLARLGDGEDHPEFPENYVADVTCTEIRTGAVLMDTRVYAYNSSVTAGPIWLTVAAGDDVRCRVIEYTGIST